MDRYISPTVERLRHFLDGLRSYLVAGHVVDRSTWTRPEFLQDELTGIAAADVALGELIADPPRFVELADKLMADADTRYALELVFTAGIKPHLGKLPPFKRHHVIELYHRQLRQRFPV